MKFPHDFHLLSMFVWCLSALACVYNLWHAGDGDSPEPRGHRMRYRVLMFLCLAMQFASGVAWRVIPVPDSHRTAWVVYFWVTYVWFTGAVVGAAALYARVMHNNRVRRVRKWRRQWGSAGYVALVLACLSFLTGCGGVDPAVVASITNDLADVATIVAQEKPGKQSDKLIADAAAVKAVTNKTLPAVQKLAADLKALKVPTTQAVK